MIFFKFIMLSAKNKFSFPGWLPLEIKVASGPVRLIEILRTISLEFGFGVTMGGFANFTVFAAPSKMDTTTH